MNAAVAILMVGLACFLAGALAASLGFYYGLRLSAETIRKEAKHGRD